jgi:hypothetical protein
MPDGGEDDYDGDGETPEPVEDPSSRSDVEEAVIQQKQDRGHPDPANENSGRPLRGRNDTAQGGRYEGLEAYAAEARKNGTSIQNAIKDYADVESRLRQNPIEGLTYLAQRMGLDPQQAAAAWYQQHYGQNGNQYAAQAAQRFQYDSHQRSIEAFRSDPSNKHFDSVRMDMARLVQSGRAKTLQQAYRLAVSQNAQLRVMAKMDRMDARRDAGRKHSRGLARYGGF